MITKEFLKEKFNLVDGILYWKNSPSRSVAAGSKAGYKTLRGYIKIVINGKTYLAHRLVYLMHYGICPKNIDHINGNPDDNRPVNLRAATPSQNGLNKRLSKESTSGIKGVSYHKHAKKWQVVVSVNSKNKYLGLFEDIDLAELVAIEARNKYHGDFARHK